MNKATFLGAFLSFHLMIQGCMGEPPKAPLSSTSLDASGKAFLVEDPALSINKNQCVPGKMILASEKGAHFTWGANKGTTTNTTTEIPVIGTTDLAGCIFPKRDSSGQTLNGATAKIDFRPLTTNSFSELRDNRIIQYIFGHDIPTDPEGPSSNTAATGILSFSLESVSGDNLTVPVAVGDSIAIKVKGTLQIAGFKVPLEVPVALTKTDSGFNAMNNAPFSVNVRGGSQALNTLGLDQRVTEILALVVNGTLQDVIDLNFNVNFVNLCP